jgi:hypothetical protein
MVGVNSTSPLKPKCPGFLSVEISMDLESKGARKVLSTLADDQVVISQFSYCFRDK